MEWWNAGRGDFLGGLFLVIFLAVAGTVITFFRKAILLGVKKFFNLVPATPPVQAPPQPLQAPPQPLQASPQPVILQFGGVQVAEPARSGVAPPNAPAPRSAIPRPPLAGFIARRDENGRDIVERLKEELLPEKNQLIVLWGPGGAGKTTLAAETARAMQDVFARIVWATADGKPDFALSTLLDEIATQLGRPELRQLAPEPKDEAVYQLLSTTPSTLIVLDNFETIPPNQQERCAEWLVNRASCPALITSRNQVLHARPVRILAMSLPEAREFLRRLIAELGNPRSFESLNREQIIDTAGRIPLVLQWVVRQIGSARQPQTVLDELSRGHGDAAKRVFDRSFDLPQLGDDGRATLLALSLFVPSASRPALAEVAGLGNDLARLDRAVQQLVELWLIEATAGNERLRVEGLTRELAKARLARDANAANYRRRFVAYFRGYAVTHSGERPEDYTALDSERDNVLNSIDIAFDLADWESVQSLAFATAEPVGGWLSVYGYWSEAIRVNQQALDAARVSNAKHQGAPFGYNLAILYGNRGELAKARTLYEDSLRVDKERGNEFGTAAGLHQLGILAQTEGNVEEARKLYSESLEIKRKLGDEEGISSSQHQLAIVAHHQGKFEEARQLYNESLEIDKKLGNARGISIRLHQLAMLAHSQGELERARELYSESLQIKRQLGNQLGIAMTLGALGRLSEAEGHQEEAERSYKEALDILDRLESPMAEVARQELERLKVSSPEN